MDVQKAFGQGVSKVKGTVSGIGIEQQRFVKNFVHLCTDGDEQGWHEGNGGNLSYRMTQNEVSNCRTFFMSQPGEWVGLGIRAEGLAGEFFLVTATGAQLRNASSATSATCGIVEIDGSGSAYRTVWGFDGGGAPTSEFPSHFMIHAVRKQAVGNDSRVIYHCHPTDSMALACALPDDTAAVTRVLWSMTTECMMLLPEGVGVVGVMTPGSRALADATAQLMRSHRAVMWAHHGLITCGKSFDEVFGLAGVVEKACSVYRSACTMCGGPDKVKGLTDEELKGIAADLNLEYNGSIM